MAEFVKVVNEQKRMCESFKLCGKCPLGKEQGLDIQCRTWVVDHPEETERIVMQWAAEHPFVTNGDKFREVFGYDMTEKFNMSPSVNGWYNAEYKEPEKQEVDDE